MKRSFLPLLLISLLAIMPISFASSQKVFTDSMNITVDDFIPTIQEWEEIGASPWINSNDTDTSVIRFNYSLENTIKTHSYWSFENLERYDIGNITSILNVTVCAWIRADTAGSDFRVKMHWYDGSTYVFCGGFATSVVTWIFWSYDISSVLDTPEKVEGVRLRLTNYGAPSYDNEGRITYLWLKVWFTYTYYVPFSFIDHYTRLGIGLGGIILMIWSPAWVAWKIKKKGLDSDSMQRIGYALLIFIVGFGLFISWIYP